jgi:hypothetical protein
MDIFGDDYTDRYIGLLRGDSGLTSSGADDGASAVTTAVRAARQSVWDTSVTWVPAALFTGRSVDYAFRRGGNYVPGSAFVLIRDTVQALVAGVAISAAAALAYEAPNESGFYDYYSTASDESTTELVSLGVATDAQTSMLALIADLAAY